jgi:hypothetical protein
MSRTGPMGQLAAKLASRRPASEDPSATQPITQPSRWPPQQQYAEPSAQQGYGQPAPTSGYFFPQSEGGQGYAPQAQGQQPQSHQLPFNHLPPAPEAGGGHGYAPQASAQPLPFSRFPQQSPEADPNFGYPQQGQEPPFNSFGGGQQHPAGQPAPGWGQQADPRGYDLNNYMSGPEAAHFQQQQSQDPAVFGAPQHGGYAETDGEFDEGMVEEEELAPRGRRGLMIVIALVGAIGLGGGMAYTYKTLFSGRAGPAPVIKDTQGPTKSKPEVADGKGFAHTDKKLLNRLGEDGGQPPASAASAESADDRQAADDPNAPRKVRIIPITPGGPGPATTAAVPPPAGPGPMMAVPGVTLENMGPRPVPQAQARVQMPPQGAPPSAARAELSQPPARPVQPPVRVASAANAPPPAAAEPAPPVKKASVVKQKQAASAAPAVTTAASPSGASGYVAVLSSQKTRMDALKVFADMQQKYGDVLSSKTPDVQEANLGDKGVWYRAVVGPPGSRDSASGVCGQLKTAGYVGCWVTAY